MTDILKVFIVDDNFVARRGLRSVLEAEDGLSVVGEASSGGEALRRLRERPADVVLMDIRMPGIDGVEATTELLREQPDARILVATVSEDPSVHMNAILAGARGYMVYGHFTPETLVDAIRGIAAGQRVNIPSLPLEMGPPQSETGRSALTQREKEILRLIAAGNDNRDIAASLGIGEKTVKNHINNIYSKIGVRSRQEAIYYMLNVTLSENA